ncbi:MAG: hypothetical protein HY275_19145, partial [Gemmatimonadetes bacterium]|nr:hypothetical protein [Gemmatimonadota bacterium]
MRPIAIAAAFCLLATVAGAQDIVGRKDRTYTLSEKLGSGASVRIFSFSGEIAITEATGNSLEFRAEKDTERGDVEDIGFVVLRNRDGITICAVRSDDDDCETDGVHSHNDSWRNWRNRAKVAIT